MTLEEDVVTLRAAVARLREDLVQAQARIAERERRKTPPPCAGSCPHPSCPQG